MHIDEPNLQPRPDLGRATRTFFRTGGVVIFWVCNVLATLLFTVFTAFAILPLVLIASFTAEIPLSITVGLLVLIAMPVVAIAFANARPNAISPFFYGVEIPIILLVSLRIGAIREMTAGGTFLIGSAIAACAIYGWHLWKDEYEHTDRPLANWNAHLLAATTSLVGIVGLFTGVLALLYAIPAVANTITNIAGTRWDANFLNPIVLIFLTLYGAMIAAFAAFPIYIASYYPGLWLRALKTTSLSKTAFAAVSLAITVLLLGVHSITSSQSHVVYLHALDKMTASEKRAAMENPERVRGALLNGYLHDYRYLETSYSQKLGRKYQRAFGNIQFTNTAEKAQSALLGPIIYAGSPSDVSRADRLYEELFDTPIQRAEQKAVTKALQATYDRDEVTAGLMNIGVRNVLLKEQNVTLHDQGTFAVVEIEEVYENLTPQNQEIFYSFSLPEDAAVTGLWIGQTPDRNKMDSFVIAPRGAAQQVYEEQLRRNIDPALLEQVGPGQYRLRIFPIPRAWSNRSSSNARDRRMRMHMRYVVPNNAGTFALPTLLEKRNVDWSAETTRRLNDEIVQTSQGWMGTTIEAKDPDATTFDVTLGKSRVQKRPVSSVEAPVSGRFAVLIDTSYSMRERASTLEKNLQELRDWGVSSPSTELDFFFHRADSGIEKTDAPDVSQLQPYGSLTLQQMIAALKDQTAQFDAVIILTDQSRYGVTAGQSDIALDQPLWVFPQGKAPAAYDDDVLDLIYRNKGGVVDSVSALQTAMANLDGRVISGSLWSVSPASYGQAIWPDQAALAARQIILARSYGTPPTPTALDELHALAQKHNVVTPYSSMIVLVNDQQRQQLEEVSKADDRYGRESHSGKERLSSPSRVPEPSPLLLIFVTCIAAWWYRKRKLIGER